MEKPYSPACERNRDPILAQLRDHFRDSRRVLEIGSGTGQHAVHFAQALPYLTWQTSDRPAHLAGIHAWLDEAALPNTPAPLAFDVDEAWPSGTFDAIFSANTLHIMSWAQVERLFAGLPGLLADNARVVIYGPFNYQGQFTSLSNAAFDASLKAQDPQKGIRDFEAIFELAQQAGLDMLEDHAMPANNRCLAWRTRRG
ncbi:DUF938 domain-containing protein [Chitinimonas arctica]|uniref:DUF938 domain-containing protein n=1 Tax=Chitinimonas arctica TaxID=2594795 RepID=A0A516SD27_9NEIS|nr:DUF938 domain-containing protein [Chitinimonas arctica]QDQ26040.1 DUF938 domain-containing protein [Chitinimonas arctica]